MAEVEIRTLGADDREARVALGAHAFGGPGTVFDDDALVVPAEEMVAAYDGERLVGTVAVIDMAQWFGGRAVPAGGVAGVTVAPDQRGRGVARRMLVEATRRMGEAGHVVSSLYPTTASLYRSLGWEVAGGWARTAIASTDLPRPTGELAWEPVAATDPVLRTTYETCATGRDGWIVPPARWWHAQGRRRELDPTPSWSWAGRRRGEAVAAVAYHHTSSERHMFDVEVDLLAGADGPALDDALAFLGASGTVVDRVRTSLPPGLLRLHVAEPSRTRIVEDWPWMLRLVDPAGAIAARGWPDGLTLAVGLEVHPPAAAPGEPERWVLEVADGEGALSPGGPGGVSLAATDLARLYAGAVDPAALATAGRLRGASPEVLSALRGAFAGDPSSPFFF